ncbi:MAG TPA: hypothetical protein PKE12_15980, partial [Kiritimatiellia bacterium]|nr:hypothetical protein [Kiritimatiellia bacterium]
PEEQDRAVFADAMDNIVEAHRWVAEQYFRDGSAELALPPLRALLHIMAYGHVEGKTLRDPDVRAQFTRTAVLAAPWYARRLEKRRERERTFLRATETRLDAFLGRAEYAQVAAELGVAARRATVRKRLAALDAPSCLESLRGTIGADLFASA